jgi:hypothetical protein
VGGVDGAPCLIACPRGETMYEVTVRFWAWVDAIGGECRG